MTQERPQKLLVSALHVMKWSRILTGAEKWILYETYIFDRGPEGAWISNASLADRLGVEEGSVRTYRARLSGDGLLVTVPRPGARQMGWVFTLPPECTPHSVKLSVDQVRAFGLILDAHLRPRRKRKTELKDLSGSSAEYKPSSTTDRSGIAPAVAPAVSGGIKGGTPSSVLTGDSQLLPAVKDIEDGVVAHATQEDGEFRQRPGESFDDWMARLAGRERRRPA